MAADLACRMCGCPRRRCVLWHDRKCCPDCTCDAWRYVNARQLNLPGLIQTLDLEPILNPETLSSLFSVTRWPL